MTKDEALKLALEVLEYWDVHGKLHQPTEEAITAIKEVLAQEQKPVATVESVATVVSESGNQEVTMSWWHEPALPVGTKLYTTPPQRTWIGLTDEEMYRYCPNWLSQSDFKAMMLHVEAKLKQKNGYAQEKNNE